MFHKGQRLMQWSAKVFRVLFVSALLFCSYGFLKDVSGVPSAWMPNDKFMHFMIFAGLAWLWLKGFAGYPVAGVLFLTVYGLAVEFAQHFLTVRTGDVWDWLADVAGIVGGWIFWQFQSKYALQKQSEQ